MIAIVLSTVLTMGPAAKCQLHPGTDKCPDIFLSANWEHPFLSKREKMRRKPLPHTVDVMKPEGETVEIEVLESPDLFAMKVLGLVGWGFGGLAVVGRAIVGRIDG